MQSRYYDAGVGRFVNEDEPLLLGISGGVCSYNLYAYCENDPVNNDDPTGQCTDALFLSPSLIAVLGSAISSLIASISASIVSLKAAIVASWIPIVCIAAAAVAVVGIVYAVNQVATLSLTADQTIAAVQARIKVKRNSKEWKDNTVYVITEKNSLNVVYVGRTNNFIRRQYEHQLRKSVRYGFKARFPVTKYDMIPIATGLTYNESRALEQAIISAFTIGRLANIVRSVSKKNLVLLAKEVERMNTLLESWIDPE